jgi:hypothetical protein
MLPPPPLGGRLRSAFAPGTSANAFSLHLRRPSSGKKPVACTQATMNPYLTQRFCARAQTAHILSSIHSNAPEISQRKRIFGSLRGAYPPRSTGRGKPRSARHFFRDAMRPPADDSRSGSPARRWPGRPFVLRFRRSQPADLRCIRLGARAKNFTFCRSRRIPGQQRKPGKGIQISEGPGGGRVTAVSPLLDDVDPLRSSRRLAFASGAGAKS